MEIEGYENYLIFEDGIVINSKTGRELKQEKNDRGYMRIALYGEKKTHFSVHRLVALAYIPNPENKPEVNHINRIRNDNRVENLEWNTPLENKQNMGIFKNNTSGEKNIKKTKYGTYTFEKTINGKYFGKCFKTMEEAVIFRDNYLSNL